MVNNDVQLVGGPCGQHGPYTFYKAFKYTKNGIKRIVTLSEFFFVKLWIDSDLLCVGELQLLWSDKNSDQVLASLRLYFLPENTPEGRMDHGEDEVLAIAEKVVLRVEDLITWITVDAEWTWGRLVRCKEDIKEPPRSAEETKTATSETLTDSSLDFSDVERERKTTDCPPNRPDLSLVIILSYPRYCRYRAMLRRLEGVENEYLKYEIVNALGGFTSCNRTTRVLFCKDTFEYPELEGHELLCNHLAPKLKGRPRGKRKKRSVSPGSESNESESSLCNVFNNSKEKLPESARNGIRCDTNSSHPRRSTRAVENNEGKEFLKELSVFMKTNYTPIGKIPSLGYKELDLYVFYSKVQKLGGYDSVTTNRLWKSVFDDMNGHANSTSAATVIRRHYERFLLPYERHIKGEEHKPLPISERRRLKSKTGSSTSDAETSESTSRSGNSTPIDTAATNHTSPTPTTPPDIKLTPPPFPLTPPLFPLTPPTSEPTSADFKPSALRSVRVKTERQKDPPTPDDIIKTEPIPIKTEKNAEPLVAVAPKSPSPVDGKENIPIPTGDTPSKSPEIVQPKTPPQIIDLDPPEQMTQATFLREVKKRKLDILKEGGLEVTPVRTLAPPIMTRDVRPTVIQPPLPRPITNEMPPPLATPKRGDSKTPTSHAFPPKVVQSRSIYSYSEKTVYGNPKECIAGVGVHAATPTPVHTPKFISERGHDILDLTVSPPKTMQQPVRPRPAPPLLDGRRLGSNLEITLVDARRHHTVSTNQRMGPVFKRPPSEMQPSNKMPRVDRPAPAPAVVTPQIPAYPMFDYAPRIPDGAKIPPIKNYAPPPQQPAMTYMPHMYDVNKGMTPYYPFLDPMYCSAMQSFYGRGALGATPPVLPFPSTDPMRLYEMMTQNPLLNYPQFSEGNPGMFKKP